MMKKIKVISFLSMALLGCGTASAQQSNPVAIERPKLVVGIVVDQMRWTISTATRSVILTADSSDCLARVSRARTP